MLRLLADENFNQRIVRGLSRRKPDLEILGVQDIGLRETDDQEILEWAAGEGRIILTHDVSTMTPFAWERVAQARPLAGLIEVPATLPIGQAIEEILIILECTSEDELEDQIWHVPL